MYAGVPTTKPVPVIRRSVAAAVAEGDAEIGDDRLTLEQQDVLGLDVAMHDAARVGVIERLGHVARDRERRIDGKRSFAIQPLAQRLAAHEGHDIEEMPRRIARIEQRQDVRMAELRRDLDLAKKSLGADGARQLGIEHLDRDLAPMAQVVGQVDRRHSAAANLALDAIPATDRRREAAVLERSFRCHQARWERPRGRRGVRSSQQGFGGRNMESGTPGAKPRFRNAPPAYCRSSFRPRRYATTPSLAWFRRRVASARPYRSMRSSMSAASPSHGYPKTTSKSSRL